MENFNSLRMSSTLQEANPLTCCQWDIIFKTNCRLESHIDVKHSDIFESVHKTLQLPSAENCATVHETLQLPPAKNCATVHETLQLPSAKNVITKSICCVCDLTLLPFITM